MTELVPNLKKLANSRFIKLFLKKCGPIWKVIQEAGFLPCILAMINENVAVLVKAFVTNFPDPKEEDRRSLGIQDDQEWEQFLASHRSLEKRLQAWVCYRKRYDERSLRQHQFKICSYLSAISSLIDEILLKERLTREEISELEETQAVFSKFIGDVKNSLPKIANEDLGRTKQPCPGTALSPSLLEHYKPPDSDESPSLKRSQKHIRKPGLRKKLLQKQPIEDAEELLKQPKTAKTQTEIKQSKVSAGKAETVSQIEMPIDGVELEAGPIRENHVICTDGTRTVLEAVRSENDHVSQIEIRIHDDGLEAGPSREIHVIHADIVPEAMRSETDLTYFTADSYDEPCTPPNTKRSEAHTLQRVRYLCSADSVIAFHNSNYSKVTSRPALPRNLLDHFTRTKRKKNDVQSKELKSRIGDSEQGLETRGVGRNIFSSKTEGKPDLIPEREAFSPGIASDTSPELLPSPIRKRRSAPCVTCEGVGKPIRIVPNARLQGISDLTGNASNEIVPVSSPPTESSHVHTVETSVAITTPYLKKRGVSFRSNGASSLSATTAESFKSCRSYVSCDTQPGESQSMNFSLDRICFPAWSPKVKLSEKFTLRVSDETVRIFS